MSTPIERVMVVTAHLYWLPQERTWVALNRFWNMETAGSFDEDIIGPYVASSEPPASDEEIRTVQDAAGTVFRSKPLYETGNPFRGTWRLAAE